MYASLIGAGVSQIYDLYKSATEKAGSTNTSFKTPTIDDTKSSTSRGTTGSSGTSGTSFSSAIQKLLVDLQAGTSASDTTSADATKNVASDLESLFKTAKGGGPGGPPPGPPPPPSDSTESTSDQSASSSSTTNSFQGLAASLLAYAKTQKLGASASTSLTA